MSLESQIAALVSAANSLTSQVAGKMNQIDQKVDEATASVPRVIRKLSQQSFFIDAIAGDDNNDGSIDSPFKTVNAANSRAVNGSYIALYFRENQTHVVNGAGFSMETGMIALVKWGAEDSLTDPILHINPTLLGNGNYSGFFCSLRTGNILISRCKVRTVFDSAEKILDRAASFIGYSNSVVSTIFHLCTIELRDMPLIAAYAGYSGRDVHLSHTSIEVLSNNNGHAKLLFNRASSYHSFKLDVFNVTLKNGITWPELIDYHADKRNIVSSMALP